MSGPYPWGGPYPLAELRAKYPQLTDADIDLRCECIRDPIFLVREVLSYGRDRTFFANPTPEHRRAADCIVAQKSFLLLMPRNHGKTTLVDEGGTVWQFLKYPNDRVLFAQASQDNAKALSRQVRWHFQATKPLRDLFPEYAMDEAKEAGNVLAWSVPCRTANTREASLELGTPETSLAGRHFDVVAGSDCVNEQNSPAPCGQGTIESMAKVKNWFGNTPLLLDTTNPRAHIRVDGTRYHDADLYGELLDSPIFEKITCGIKDDPEGRPISIWDKMSRDKLEFMRAAPAMTVARWAAQMQNDPKPAEDSASFRESWFDTYDGDAPTGLSVAITVDPAFTTQEKNPDADSSAIVVSGVAPVGHPMEGRLYILAIRDGRWSPRDLLDNIHALIAAWDPSWVGIEAGHQTEALKSMFFEDLRRTGRNVNYRELPTRGKNKIVRAMALLAHAEKYHIHVKRPEHETLVQQCLRFPVGKHEDYVDALAYRAQDMAFHALRSHIQPAVLTCVPGRKPMTGAEAIERANKRARERTMKPWTRTVRQLG